MGRIVELPESVRVRIAAGEVVERPASVVKELLDNAIDAGARSVTVELSGGGIDLVRVTDDGSGMDREDLVLSVRRHATSKLSSAEDLERIATLGFRGEALPSIGSVSRMRIRSRASDADSAWALAVDGGVESAPTETSGAPGTSVEVRTLFYNVPVRRRFLRSPSTEAARSSEVVVKTALARPGVAFRLIADGRESLSGGASGDLRARIADVMGGEVASSLIEMEAGEPKYLHLKGFIAPPDVSRSNRSYMHVCVNGRPVDAPVVLRALTDAYAGAIAPRRFPVAVLFLELEHGDVDVNVHPAKREVRLRSGQAVYRLVHGAAREAVSRARPSAPLGAAPARPAVGARPGAAADAPSESPARGEVRTYDLWGGEKTYPTPGRPVGPSATPPAAAPDREQGLAARIEPGTCYYVGQTQLGYLVAEIGDEIRILDPHALHERVIFERLSAAEAAAESQGLLTPVSVELDAANAQRLESMADEFARLGFEVEPFGGGTFLVRSVPSVLRPGAAEECIRDMLDRVCETGPEAGAIREKLLAGVACAGAVKLGERLSSRQAVSLIEEAEASGVAARCPHGRPTALVVRRSELERRFGR